MDAGQRIFAHRPVVGSLALSAKHSKVDPMKKLRRTPAFKLQVEWLETRELPSTAPVWTGFARDAQHSALSTVASQSLDAIRWSTPVDTNKQYSLIFHDLH